MSGNDHDPANGQITLPKAARDRLDAVPGDKIVLVERRGHFELEACLAL